MILLKIGKCTLTLGKDHEEKENLMKHTNTAYPLCLTLFDGAAAPAGTPATGEAGSAQPGGGEDTSYTRKGKRANPLANVQYGKQPAASEAGPAQEPQHHAADGTTTKTTSNTLEERKAEFEKLIQGEYKDLFQEKFQQTFDKRFKDHKALEHTVEQLQPVLELLGTKYGVSDGNIDALVQAIEEDDSYFEDEAMEQGVTVEQLKHIRQIERENAQLRQAQEELQTRRNAEKTYSQWMAQAEQVREIYPNFDFSTECENPNFTKLLRAGVDVKAAFEAAHMDEILGGAMAVTAQKVSRQVVNNIQSRGRRPCENGISSQAGTIVKNDVSKLTAADRREIIRRVNRGEKISF